MKDGAEVYSNDKRTGFLPFLDLPGRTRQSLELAKQTNKQDVIDALVSVALVSERTGKLDQARDYADQTIALVPKDGNRLDVLYPMLVKGHVAARMHDPQQAEKIYREIEQDPKSHVFLKWEAEHSLAQLYDDESQSQSADREYRAALSTFETARSSLKGEDLQLPFPSNALGIYDDYIHFLASQGKTVEALQVAEYSRGRTLAEGLGLLQKGTTFKPVALNPQEIARRDSFLLARREAILSLDDYRAENQLVYAASEIGNRSGGAPLSQGAFRTTGIPADSR